MSKTQRGPNDREEPVTMGIPLYGYGPIRLEVESPPPPPGQTEAQLEPPEPAQPTEGEETLTDE